MKLNPKCYYSPDYLQAVKRSALIWLAVAERTGKESHPEALEAAHNLKTIEGMIDGRSS